MSLRSVFRAADLEQLRARLDRLDANRPDRWLDPFPELWLVEGANWLVEAAGFELRDATGRRCDHAFELLCGEAGAWSYLCASFLHRELSALTAAPGLARRDEWLLGEPAIAELAEGIQSPDLPDDWRPCVIEDNTRVTVQFFTRRGRGIFAQEDRYPAEGFELQSRELLLARAEAG